MYGDHPQVAPRPIERVKQRAAAKEAKADPAVNEAMKVAKAIANALGAAKDHDLADALMMARDALGAYLDSKGVALPKARQRRAQRDSAAA